MKRQLTLATSLALGLAAAACGGNVPSADRIKADFESPSGSTKSRQTVAGAYATNEASSTAGRLAGAFSPVGGALTQVQRPIERVGIARMMSPYIARLQERVEGKSSRALSSGVDFEACGNSQEIESQLAESFASGSTSGSFDVDVDLGACSGGQLTGKLSISGSFDVDTDSFVFDVTETMVNVCETEGEKYCINGEYQMEATMTSAKIELVTGWYATASWTEDGAAKSIVTKGGIRLGFDEMGSGAAEYLVYVKDENGEEQSLVLKIEATNEGVTYSIRGNDGSITCTIDSSGAGQCDGDLTWDAAYVDQLESSEDFTG